MAPVPVTVSGPTTTHAAVGLVVPTLLAALMATLLALPLVVTAADAAPGAKTSSNRSAPPPNPTTKGRAVRPAASSRPSRPVDLAPAPVTTGDPQKEKTQQAAERDRLNARIAELKRQIAAGEKSASGAAAAMARAEQALVEVNRRLDLLGRRQRATQELVVALEHQRTGTEQEIADRKGAFARTVTRLASNHGRDPVAVFLDGGDPNEPIRTDAYLRYLARAEATNIDGLQRRSADLQSRRQRADDDGRALAAQAETEKSAQEALANDRAAQRQTLRQLSQKLTEQRTAAYALEADERRLTRIVQQLQRAIERQAAEERARRETARVRAEQQAAAAARRSRSPSRDGAVTPPRESSPPPRVDAVPDQSTGGGAFAQLRGQLRLPVRGTVVGRFGGARGNGGATWKGVFVRTDAGADVRAVAAGHVIFADDLRGFGNLLIVDHGDQYLSIYGNNETLLRKTGDSVKAGDVVSRAGDSSGDDQTGLYFELRFRGRPFDPMPWVGGR